jgi:hypothetical protein
MTESIPCSDSELKFLEEELKTIKRNLAIGAGFAIVIAFVVPWLGASKTHGKAMVNYMSYPAAVICVSLVMALILAAYYFMTAPKIKKDLKEKTKLVLRAAIVKKESVVYRKIKGAYLILNSPPETIRRVAVTPLEFEEFKEKDNVVVEYFKNSKKIIKVTSLHCEESGNSGTTRQSR